MSVYPLAEDFAAWSTYNYVLGNPVMFVDPDGKEPGDPDPPGGWKSYMQNGWKNFVNEYFNSLTFGGSEESSQTVSRSHETSSAFGDYHNVLLDRLDEGLQGIESAADKVETTALAATAVSGGSAAPLTAPTALVAEVVGDAAFVAQVCLDICRDDGEVNPGQIVTKVAFKIVGAGISKGVDDLGIGSQRNQFSKQEHFDQTKDAVDALGQTVNNVSEFGVETHLEENE